MTPWLRARTWGLFVFALIVALVVGGLGWVTAAAWRLELSDQLRLALWRLDSRVTPTLAREDSRPFQHYDPLYFPLPAFQSQLLVCAPGTVLIPSPLLNAELPDWMLLHFQCFQSLAEANWLSPQVHSPELTARLGQVQLQLDLTNVTARRAELLAALSRHYRPAELRDRLPDVGEIFVLPNYFQVPEQQQGQMANPAPQQYLANPNRDNDFNNRARQQQNLKQESTTIANSNGLNFSFFPIGEVIPWAEFGNKWGGSGSGQSSVVKLGSFKPLWLRVEGQPEQLILARLAQSGQRKVVQGVLLDWPRLRDVLLTEVQDLLPDARLEPIFDDESFAFPERRLTALPIQLVPGPQAESLLGGWSPLRFGLLLAWTAALLALLVVGLGGWSLLDLSERRFRFVSAVTHELRTPLTTLRLYLDMINSGLVRDEAQKTEYLKTLDGESNRLHRLVGNVLDFARLEKQRPRLSLRETTLEDLLEQVRVSWEERCRSVDKELIVVVEAGCRETLRTDVELVQQVLGNLIDNACKYSRTAADGRIWLRARPDGQRWLALEVEDRGPGVPAREQSSVFRAFRRGRQADVTAGGVGLGLALARRWTTLLGGRLKLQPGSGGVGACFRLLLRG